VTENSSSLGSIGLGTTLPEDGKRAGFQNVTLNLKKSAMDKVQKKKTVLITFSHAVFSLLSTDDDLVMQALIWLHMVRFGASYVNLRQPHILKHQIQVKKKSLSCIRVDMVFW